MTHNDSKTHRSLLGDLKKRQDYVLKKLPRFFMFTITCSIIMFLLIVSLQWYTNSLPTDRYGLVSLSNPNLGSVIALILGLSALLIHLIFFVLSLIFIPYIGFQAFKGAQTTDSGRRGFRWIQLTLSALLPMAIFAIIWSSFPPRTENTIILLKAPKDVMIVIFGALLVCGLLWVINKTIPIKLISLRISLFSFMIYAALFLSYGGGVSLLSYIVLFGILTYLTIDTDKIEEISRRIIIYDYDPNIVDELDKLALRNQKVRVDQDKISIKKDELLIKKEEHHEAVKAQNIETEIDASLQMSDIEKTRIEFNKKTNRVILSTLDKKVNMIQSMQEVLSTEYNKKVTENIEEQIRKLKEDSKNYTPDVLSKKMISLMHEMDESLKNAPTNLRALQTEMVAALEETAQQIQNQTKNLEHSEDSSKNNEKSVESKKPVKSIFNQNVPSLFSSIEQENISKAFSEALDEGYKGTHNIFIVNSVINKFQSSSHALERLVEIISEKDIDKISKETNMFIKNNIKLISFSTPVKNYISVIFQGKNNEIIILSLSEDQTTAT